MGNYNRGKKFKKNTRKAYVKNKVNVINSMPFLNDEPLESVDEISNIVKDSLADKRTYMLFKNLDPNKVVVYYIYLLGVLGKIHEEEKLTKFSALTWISEHLDFLDNPPSEVKDMLDKEMGIFEEAVLESGIEL